MSTVSEILDGIKLGFPNKVNLARVNRAVRLISKRLFYHESSLVKGALDVTVAAGESSSSLPPDFWGMLSWPYIVGKTYRLNPLPNIETQLAYTQKSEPRYFDVKGFSIHLYPGTISQITIGGDYWTRPASITGLADILPYNELFDEALKQALINTPPTEAGRNENEGSIMQAIINDAVDEIAPRFKMKAPTHVEDNMNLDSMSNEDWF